MASGSTSFCKGSDEIYNKDCDVCLSTGKISEAISYCNICCEYLCKFCDVTHRGSRASKDHQILTLSNIPSVSTRKQPTLRFMFCDTHTTSLLDTYCTSHDEVICRACKMSNHSTCKTGDVSSHSAKTDVGNELKKAANLLRDLANKYDILTQNRHTDKSTVMSQIQNCFSHMKQFRKDINDKLDKLEKKMSAKIQQIEKTINNEIDGHVTLADDILHQIGDLDKSLSQCEKRRDNDVMFVGSKKAFSRAGEFGRIIGQVHKEIYQIDICFQPNDVLSDMIQQLQSLGTVDNNRQLDSGPNHTSILNVSVIGKRVINVGLKIAQGCTFMPDGHLVFACVKEGLKLFDENFHFQNKLSVKSVEVSPLNDTDVIITQGLDKQLKLVRIFPKMKVKKTFNMDRICVGVDVYGDEIYVTCHDDPGNGEVRVLDTDGNMVRRLGVDHNGKYMFTRPNCVKVNRNGSRVFVSDEYTHTVTCLNNLGIVIYRYSDTDLNSPAGMYVDEDDNLLVCGIESNNVHMIRHDGTQEKILLSVKDGLHMPLSVLFRPSDGCLVVVLYGTAKTDQKPIVFSTR